MLGGAGTARTVIRLSGDIDVHIVSHSEAGHGKLPSLGAALSWKRRAAGFALAVVGLPVLSWILHEFRSPESLTSDVLVYQLLVVVVALVGGIWPALFSAVVAGLLLDFLFVEPYYTITISDPLHFLTLVIFVIVAVLVSVVVDQAARRAQAAARSAAEAEVLVSPFAADELLARIRALSRRQPAATEEPVVTFGDVTIDLSAHVAPRAGATVRLTPTEWRLLEVLLRNPGRLVTRETLLTEVWVRSTRPTRATCGCTSRSCARSSNRNPPPRGTW